MSLPAKILLYLFIRTQKSLKQVSNVRTFVVLYVKKQKTQEGYISKSSFAQIVQE